MEPATKKSNGEDLNENEATQYDRQIRLWGLEAQKRIRSTRMLVIGCQGLAAEVCKNLILAGVKSLTILDDATTTMEDLSGNFYLLPEDIGKPRCRASLDKFQALNPNVVVSSDTSDWKTKDTAFFQGFDVVCMTVGTFSDMARVNDMCRTHGVQFFGSNVFGFFGFFFTDLQSHEYIFETRTRAENPDDDDIVKQERRRIEYVSLRDALTHTWSGQNLRRAPKLYFALRVADAYNTQHGVPPKAPSDAGLGEVKASVLSSLGLPADAVDDDFICLVGRNYVCQLVAVTAVVGGLVSGEVIKAISGKDEPHNNLFLYDGVNTTGNVELLQAPKKPAAAAASTTAAVVEIEL